MLAKVHRLTGAREFASTIRQGGRKGSATLVVHLRTGDDARPPRVGLVVSRAVGPAVIRNRVKRRLRHLVADRLDGLPPGSLLVLRALPASADAGSAALAADLDRALGRLLEGVS